jgi:hypothetical protein
MLCFGEQGPRIAPTPKTDAIAPLRLRVQPCIRPLMQPLWPLALMYSADRIPIIAVTPGRWVAIGSYRHLAHGCKDPSGPSLWSALDFVAQTRWRRRSSISGGWRNASDGADLLPQIDQEGRANRTPALTACTAAMAATGWRWYWGHHLPIDVLGPYSWVSSWSSSSSSTVGSS